MNNKVRRDSNPFFRLLTVIKIKLNFIMFHKIISFHKFELMLTCNEFKIRYKHLIAIKLVLINNYDLNFYTFITQL